MTPTATKLPPVHPAGVLLEEFLRSRGAAGGGGPCAGLKPAGLSKGPIIPLAGKAIEGGNADELIAAPCGESEAGVSSGRRPLRALPEWSGHLRRLLRRRARKHCCDTRLHVLTGILVVA